MHMLCGHAYVRVCYSLGLGTRLRVLELEMMSIRSQRIVGLILRGLCLLVCPHK